MVLYNRDEMILCYPEKKNSSSWVIIIVYEHLVVGVEGVLY